MAEVFFANFVAEHNISFMTAEHFFRLTSAMFPDTFSRIAKQLSSTRTKITCIVKGVLYMPIFF